MIRVCEWCERTIGPRRRDAVYCSKSCRQASWRYGKGCRSRAASSRPKFFAYADPPYPGLAGYYRDHVDFEGEVDHRELVDQLTAEFPDGWALSTSADALPTVLRLCPEDVKVGAWVRGERPGLSWYPLSAWEPVIYRGGRAYKPSTLQERRLDALVFRSHPRRTQPDRVIGAKPAEFAWWMFDLLGALPGDELVDLYPGSGGIGRAWGIYTSRAEVPTKREGQ